jgi:hypothetical protein
MFDRFTRALAFANFFQAFKVLFGEEMADPACGNKFCHGSNECPSSCHCASVTSVGGRCRKG